MCSTLSETQTESKSPAGIQTEIRFDSAEVAGAQGFSTLDSSAVGERAEPGFPSAPVLVGIWCSVATALSCAAMGFRVSIA
ncbi:hypothetical protein CRENBAI_025768 [Crenichthys baileyi]|uniref:Uncharacterized protein n=1 Tax=Crenichthys baileyi TaxID=28760 RepID=A0AAV9RPB3_9TELE